MEKFNVVRNIYISTTKFENADWIHIRDYFSTDDGEMMRTKRGVAIKIQDLNTLKGKIRKISDDVYTEKKEPITGNLFISCSRYNNKEYIHLRYFDDGKPSKRGVWFFKEDLNTLMDGLAKVEEFFNDCSGINFDDDIEICDSIDVDPTKNVNEVERRSKNVKFSDDHDDGDDDDDGKETTMKTPKTQRKYDKKLENAPKRLKKRRLSGNSKQLPKKLRLKVDEVDDDTDSRFYTSTNRTVKLYADKMKEIISELKHLRCNGCLMEYGNQEGHDLCLLSEPKKIVDILKAEAFDNVNEVEIHERWVDSLGNTDLFSAMVQPELTYWSKSQLESFPTFHEDVYNLLVCNL